MQEHRYDVVIVGAGGHGLATAYCLLVVLRTIFQTESLLNQ